MGQFCPESVFRWTAVERIPSQFDPNLYPYYFSIFTCGLGGKSLCSYPHPRWHTGTTWYNKVHEQRPRLHQPFKGKRKVLLRDRYRTLIEQARDKLIKVVIIGPAHGVERRWLGRCLLVLVLVLRRSAAIPCRLFRHYSPEPAAQKPANPSPAASNPGADRP